MLLCPFPKGSETILNLSDGIFIGWPLWPFLPICTPNSLLPHLTFETFLIGYTLLPMIFHCKLRPAL